MVNLFTSTMTIFHSNQYHVYCQIHPCIQRLVLHLQKHNSEMHYIQGSLLTVANTLSTATLTDCQAEVNENESNCFVHFIIQIT